MRFISYFVLRHYDWIWVTDADTYINNLSIRIENYIDNDYNAKVSPGDIIRFFPGEGDTLTDLSNLDDFSFRLKYNPTGDTIGYNVDFAS